MIRVFAVILLAVVLSSFGSFAQLNKGLIAHYPLNEGGGTIIVDKTRFNNGTLNNTALSSTSGWNLRKGIVLDGVNDNIQRGKSNISAMSAMTSMTASCWLLGVLHQIVKSYRVWRCLTHLVLEDGRLLLT